MSKPETWVQMYEAQITPGPDGQPVNLKEFFHPAWISIPGEQTRVTSHDGPSGRITRQWMRLR